VWRVMRSVYGDVVVGCICEREERVKKARDRPRAGRDYLITQSGDGVLRRL